MLKSQTKKQQAKNNDISETWCFMCQKRNIRKPRLYVEVPNEKQQTKINDISETKCFRGCKRNIRKMRLYVAIMKEKNKQKTMTLPKPIVL